MTDFNKKNLFKIPGNYFQELEHSLIENAKAIKVEKSLSTPKNYFNTLDYTYNQNKYLPEPTW